MKTRNLARGAGDCLETGSWTWGKEWDFVLQSFEADKTCEGHLTPVQVFPVPETEPQKPAGK